MMHRILNISALLIFILYISVATGTDVEAQCAMCRATVESNATMQQGIGKGLNTGILYLMSIPYLLIAALAYLWYVNSKKETERQNRIFNVLKRKLSS